MNWKVTMFVYEKDIKYASANRLILLDDDHVILNPVYTKKVNDAGSFTFNILPDHEQYHVIEPLCCYVEVLYKNKLVWRGRVDSVEEELNGVKNVVCLGIMSTLHDTVQFARRNGTTQLDLGVVEVKNMSAYEIFRRVLSLHDCGVDGDCFGFSDKSDVREFGLDSANTGPKNVYAEFLHEDMDTLETITYFAEKLGLYIFNRTPQSQTAINELIFLRRGYYYGLPKIDVEVGKNVIEFNRQYNNSEYYNAIVARGLLEKANPINNSGLNVIEAPRYNDVQPDNTNGLYAQNLFTEYRFTDTSFIGMDLSEFEKYGFIYKFRRNELLSKGSDVLTWARSELSGHSSVRTSQPYFKTKVANISIKDGDVFLLDIGDGVNVICQQLNINKKATITGITVYIDNPISSELEIGYESDGDLAYEVK